jgi:protocatechuate 3,4-dioxygenase beta subunit
MFPQDRTHSRRRFLGTLTAYGSAIGASALIAGRPAAEEPFDSLPASVWSNSRRNGLIMIHRLTPSNLSWRAEIARDDEPGTRLIVEGQVFSPDGRTPAPGVTVYAYNTDAQGYYGENHKEYPPRIYGWMKTDTAGRFELHTIHPGNYPGMRVPAHIHFDLWGAGYPLQWTEELKFDGDRYITSTMLAGDEKQGEFRTIQRVSRNGDGISHCRFKIKLQRESNFH